MTRTPPLPHRRLLTAITIGTCLIVVGSIIWFAGSVAGDRALRTMAADGRASAALHAALLRSELQKFRLVPLALANDPEAARVLATRDPATIARFDRRLEQLSDNIRAAAIYLIDADGQTLAASNWNRSLSFVGANYAFRAYFREALAKGAFEQFALGTVSRVPGLYIARRVSVDGRRGVVVLKVEFDQLETEWAQSGSPAFVTNADGVVLITSIPAWRFRTEHPISPREQAMMRRNLDFGDAPLSVLPIASTDRSGVVTVTGSGDEADGRYVETVSRTSTPGWTLHVLTPVGTSVDDARDTARLIAAILAALATLGIVTLLRRRARRRAEARRQENARAALEAEVEARTRDLRVANSQLMQEMADRRISEAKLQSARDQLVQANKLASLGQITAGVAHEISQPVAAIRSYADNGRLLVERSRFDDLKANLDRIVSMTDRIGAITGELRGFARQARGTTGPIAIGEAVDGALLLLRDRLERHGIAVLKEGDFTQTVIAERVRLEQVLVNLIANAVEAIDQGGGSRIVIRVASVAAGVVVDIADDGPGLTDKLAAELFRPFTTTKEQGLGLGLIISRDIARDLGGDLVLVTDQGERNGATFRLTLVRA